MVSNPSPVTLVHSTTNVEHKTAVSLDTIAIYPFDFSSTGVSKLRTADVFPPTRKTFAIERKNKICTENLLYLVECNIS